MGFCHRTESDLFLFLLMLFKVSNSFFYTQKVAYFVQRQVILIRSNPTYLRSIADQTRSKYEATYAVPPHNIRPGESGIIPERARVDRLSGLNGPLEIRVVIYLVTTCL